MPPKPTVLIVPGAASPAVMYKELANHLTSIGGYEVHVHDLLSASRCPPEEPAGLHEDADFFRSKLEDLCEAGKDVVVLCHSYGGLVATDAAHGLGKDKRERERSRGGIIRIVYLTCIVGPMGASSAEVCKDVPKYDFMVPANEVCGEALLFLRVVLLLGLSSSCADWKVRLTHRMLPIFVKFQNSAP